MSRIYWDTMLFLYWLENRGDYALRVQTILDGMAERRDTLCTSVFTLGEALTGPYKAGDPSLAGKIKNFIRPPFVEILPFDANAADRYAHIRAAGRISPPDAVHLACAGAAEIDLFLTNDRRLHGVRVPGINFITSMDTDLF